MIVFLLCAFWGRWLAALSPELYFAALTRRVSTFRSQGQARSTPWRLPPAPVAGRHKPRAGQAPFKPEARLTPPSDVRRKRPRPGCARIPASLEFPRPRSPPSPSTGPVPLETRPLHF